MKIAILTYHRAYNCGAMLQAWALKNALERLGHTVEFPACNNVGFYPRIKRLLLPDMSFRSRLKMLCAAPLIHLLSIGVADLARMRYNRFRRKYLPERKCSPDKIDSLYDVIIVGSDQVWSERHSGVDTDLFLGKNISTSIPIISYAASYGDKYLEHASAVKLAGALSRYCALSVRENIVRNQMSEFGFRDIKVVADPTLLMDREDYDTISIDPKFQDDYLYCYSVNMSRRMVHKVREIAKKLGVKAVITPVYQYSRFRAQPGITYGVSPERMVGFVKNAKYVVAVSFHGTALSLIYGKPFISLREGKDEFESRPASLLNRINMGNRVVPIETDTETMVKLMLEPYPADAQKNLSKFKDDSIMWLKNAIIAARK